MLNHLHRNLYDRLSYDVNSVVRIKNVRMIRIIAMKINYERNTVNYGDSHRSSDQELMHLRNCGACCKIGNHETYKPIIKK